VCDKAYQQEHNGCCNVPLVYRPDPQLGNWVNWQGYCYRKGLLKRERCDQLDMIGFEWRLHRKKTLLTDSISGGGRVVKEQIYNEVETIITLSTPEQNKTLSMFDVMLQVVIFFFY